MSIFSNLIPTGADVETIYQEAYEEETKYNNFEKALKLYEKAAKKGLAKAQYYCGFMYLKGRGGNRDKEKALYYVEQAAIQGHPHGQYLLAQMYLSGEGVELNKQLGNEWMGKYRLHGHTDRVILCFHSY